MKITTDPTVSAAEVVRPVTHTGFVAGTPVRFVGESPLAPADGALLPRLVHTLAAAIAAAPVRPNPGMLKAATARVVADTAWAHYRPGRQRLASLGAVYLNRYLLGADSTFMAYPVLDRQVLRFDTPEGLWFFDELVVSGYEHELDERITALLEHGDENFGGIRVLHLSDPAESHLVDPFGHARQLDEMGAAAVAVGAA